MKIKNIFYNPREQRTRFFWRIAFQLTLIVLMTFGSTLVIQLFYFAGILSPIGLTMQDGMLISSVILLAAIMLSIWLTGRWLDRRRLSGFGLHLSRSWWQDLAFGLGLGALLMSLIFLVEWGSGLVTVSGTLQGSAERPFALGIIIWTGIYLCVGIYEEMFFRGYYLTNIAEWLGHFKRISPQWAVITAFILTSAVFGIGHMSNPNASFISTVNIVFAGLLILGLGYVLTGEMAISIGMHITWNMFQGMVLGFPVSGMGSGQTSFIAIVQNGPAWLTGGDFGPEAGILGLLAMLLGAFAIFWWVRKKYGKVQIATQIAEPPQDFYKPVVSE